MGPPIYIGEWKLRELFNSAILPRVEAEDLVEFIESDGAAHPKFGQKPGARSQIVAYYEPGPGEGKIFGPKIAVVHRYLNPDGSLGASGKLDPKSIMHEGQLYFGKKPKALRRGKGGSEKR